MNRVLAVLRACLVLALVILPVQARAATTTVSVGFTSGFVGEYSNNAHQPVSISTFPTLGIDSVTISQTTDNGQFGGSQGNDYAVTVRIQFTNGSTQSFPAAVNWRDTQGSTIHGIGLTVAPGTPDGTSYVARSGYSKTYLFQFVGSTRVYTDTAVGQSSGVVSGNAATNGLLSSLNSYLAAAPASTTPSGLTSTITAAAPSIAANGTATTLITVQLKDVNGNPITSGASTVTLATTAGTLSAVTNNGNGTYTATLTSSTSTTTATITGTVGGVGITDDAQVQFAGTAAIAGTLTRANGTPVSGQTVKLLNGASQVVATTTTGANGTYLFSAVAPGTYTVQFDASGTTKAKARSATGNSQGSLATGVTVGSSGTVSGVDAVVIDPAGVIYNSVTRAPVANAVVSLYYNNAKVSNSWLDASLGGLNDQVTGAAGTYSFVLNGAASSGTYELRVAAPSGYTGSPSTVIAPSGTFTPGLGGGLEAIQSQSTAPTGIQPTTYYLLFNFTVGTTAATTSNGVTNDHIPIDPVVAAPVFTATNATDASNNPSYAFAYDENRTAGTTLGTVAATGTGTLTYTITAGNGSGWFAIDPASGAITLTAAGAASAANDFETLPNSQTLTVQVSDGTRTTAIEVKLSERNVDDTAPVITGPGGVAGATTAAIAVNENQTAVATLAASGTVTWSLVGGEDQARFAIDPATGVLTFLAAPDFEAPTDGATAGTNTYIVQVKAIDAAGNAALQTITVTVLDVVETGAPVFTATNATDASNNPSYAVAYDENRTAGTTLGTVSATGTGTLTYTITAGNGSGWFALDPASGAITLTAAGAASAANDFETLPNSQTLTVQVSDGTRTTAIEVKLSERNVDDTAPVITGPGGVAGATTAAIAVNENQTAVATLAASEAVTWSLVGGEDQARFAIDPATGVLTFLAAPDFEAPTDGATAGTNTYIVQVKAIDAAGNAALQTITVTVLDVVETLPPAFANTNASDGAGRPSYAFAYDENRTAGTTLGTVAATGTGTLTYTITAGNGSGWFALDPATGAITLTAAGAASAANDFETLPNSQTLTVQVSDGTRTTAIETTLSERNVDDTAPVITGPSGGPGASGSAVTIDEGVTLATTLAANERVTWSLAGGVDAALLAIDPATGALSFLAETDYENPTDADRNNVYLVTIRATDTAGNASLQSVAVTVRNVDEIAQKLAQIADPLRNSLRSHALRSLGDMLAFNEQLLTEQPAGACATRDRKPVSGALNAGNAAQSARLGFAKRLQGCERRYRVYLDGAVAASRQGGVLSVRTLASARMEADVSGSLVLGAGIMATYGNNPLRGFADSAIRDNSLQVSLYGRQRLGAGLRLAAFAGYGKAWYSFALADQGFDLSGRMTGDRLAYGGTLTGVLRGGAAPITTDLVVTHAEERLGSATLAAAYRGEQRAGIGLAVGQVGVTRLSVPLHLPVELQRAAYEGGDAARIEFSPGLLCENSASETAALLCGVHADARLSASHGGRTRGYLDASYERVQGLERYLAGIGVGYRFGPEQALELGMTVNAGVTGMRSDARALVQLKVVR